MTSQQPVRGVGGLDDQIAELIKVIEHVFGTNISNANLPAVKARGLFTHIAHEHWGLSYREVGRLISRNFSNLRRYHKKQMVWDEALIWKYKLVKQKVCRYRTEGPYNEIRADIERLEGGEAPKQTLENRTLGRTWV